MNVPRWFWFFLAIFEIAFGGLIFMATRSYYLNAAESPQSMTPAIPLPSPAAGNPGLSIGPALNADSIRSPEELSELADQHFSNGQYEAAVLLYEQLLPLDQTNVDLLNNLAITLHYIGRSDEALDRAAQGIAIDPSHQRIWLTSGFILSQTGQSDEALISLRNAIAINPVGDIADSARRMIAEIEGQ